MGRSTSDIDNNESRDVDYRKPSKQLKRLADFLLLFTSIYARLPKHSKKPIIAARTHSKEIKKFKVRHLERPVSSRKRSYNAIQNYENINEQKSLATFGKSVSKETEETRGSTTTIRNLPTNGEYSEERPIKRVRRAAEEARKAISEELKNVKHEWQCTSCFQTFSSRARLYRHFCSKKPCRFEHSSSSAGGYRNELRKTSAGTRKPFNKTKVFGDKNLRVTTTNIRNYTSNEADNSEEDKHPKEASYTTRNRKFKAKNLKEENKRIRLEHFCNELAEKMKCRETHGSKDFETKCHTCNGTFSKQEDLYKHVKNQNIHGCQGPSVKAEPHIPHPQSQPDRNVLSTAINNINTTKIGRNVLRLDGETGFRCESCMRILTTEVNLVKHFNKFHKGEKLKNEKPEIEKDVFDENQ